MAGLCLVVAGGLSSCTSALEHRITKNPQLYQRLSVQDQGLVSRGEIREGMTKEAVFLAWGRADYISSGKDRGAPIDKWIYLDSHPVYTPTYRFGFGPMYYGYGYAGYWDPYWAGWGPSVTYMPYQRATVEFRNDRVIRFMSAPAPMP